MTLDVCAVADSHPDFVPDLVFADPPYGQRRFINRFSRRPGDGRGAKAGEPLQSDIIGDEDHFGDMDFKIAGTQNGITGIQLDLKIKGISEEIIRATMLAVIGTRAARGRRSWRAYPK